MINDLLLSLMLKSLIVKWFFVWISQRLMLRATPTRRPLQTPSVSLNLLLLSRAQSRSMHTNTRHLHNKTNRPITRHYLPAVGPTHANFQKPFFLLNQLSWLLLKKVKVLVQHTTLNTTISKLITLTFSKKAFYTFFENTMVQK